MKERPCSPQLVFFFFTEILMSFYSGDKLLLFQEPKYFPLDFNINYNLFSVISFLSIGFFSSCIPNCQIALAFLCWILITVFFFYSVLQKITIFRTGLIYSVFAFYQSQFYIVTSNITEKALKKLKIIGLNFPVCCLFFGFFVFVAVVVDITLNLPYYGQANKISHQ